MERTFISPNIPNFITIGLMAIGAFILFSLIWQGVSRFTGGGGGGTGTTTTDAVFTGGDVDAG